MRQIEGGVWLALEVDMRTHGAIQLSSFDPGIDSHEVRAFEVAARNAKAGFNNLRW